MNIQQTMPSPESLAGEGLAELNLEAITNLLTRRRAIYAGFAKIEEMNSNSQRVWVNLHGKQGQDYARALWARGIEEVLEATESRSRAHMLEELIDALNFVLSLVIMSPEIYRRLQNETNNQLGEMSLVERMYYWPNTYRAACFKGTMVDRKSTDELPDPWPKITDMVFSRWLESFSTKWLSTLRNRSWQHSVQSAYFDGTNELLDLAGFFLIFVLQYFKSWEEFACYYIAKEAVLTFRLETNY